MTANSSAKQPTVHAQANSACGLKPCQAAASMVLPTGPGCVKAHLRRSRSALGLEAGQRRQRSASERPGCCSAETAAHHPPHKPERLHVESPMNIPNHLSAWPRLEMYQFLFKQAQQAVTSLHAICQSMVGYDVCSARA